MGVVAALGGGLMCASAQEGCGYLDLDRLQRKIMVARNASAKQLSEAGILFEQMGDAGLFLWGSVPASVDVDLLVQDAYRNKILLMRGSVFSASEQPNHHIRFNVAFSQHPRLSQYLQERLSAVVGVSERLGRVLRKET